MQRTHRSGNRISPNGHSYHPGSTASQALRPEGHPKRGTRNPIAATARNARKLRYVIHAVATQSTATQKNHSVCGIFQAGYYSANFTFGTGQDLTRSGFKVLERSSSTEHSSNTEQ